MNKLKNKKRTQTKEVKKHKCQWEYSSAHSTPDYSVWICTNETCDLCFAEYEDSPAGC